MDAVARWSCFAVVSVALSERIRHPPVSFASPIAPSPSLHFILFFLPVLSPLLHLCQQVQSSDCNSILFCPTCLLVVEGSLSTTLSPFVEAEVLLYPVFLPFHPLFGFRSVRFPTPRHLLIPHVRRVRSFDFSSERRRIDGFTNTSCVNIDDDARFSRPCYVIRVHQPACGCTTFPRRRATCGHGQRSARTPAAGTSLFAFTLGPRHGAPSEDRQREYLQELNDEPSVYHDEPSHLQGYATIHESSNG